MPRRTMKCRQVKQQSGRLYVRFSDKVEKEFDSRADLRDWCREQINDDVLRALVLASVLEDASDATPLSACEGRKLSLDLSAPIHLEFTAE